MIRALVVFTGLVSLTGLALLWLFGEATERDVAIFVTGALYAAAVSAVWDYFVRRR